MSHLTVEVEKRDSRGKNTNRRLRAAGQVPAVVYGGGKEPVAIQVGQRQFENLMRSAGNENAVFLLKMAGTDQSRHTMIRELQQDPINGKLIHIDFLRVVMDQAVKAMVPVEIHGLATGVKNEGGILDFVTREVEVQCLPDKIPVHLDVDVSELHIGQHLEAKDLELPEGVEILEAPERVLVSISAPKGGAEDEVDEDGDLIEKETAEPEVIKRGKGEDE